MHKLTNESMANAIQRAKAVHPKVKIIDAAGGVYAVSSSNGRAFYTVKFVSVNGLNLAGCDCRARATCFHIAAAAPLNVWVQQMHEVNPTPDDSKAFLARNVGWCI